MVCLYNGAPTRTRTADLLIHTTTTFAATHMALCGLDFLFTLAPKGFRWVPSSLYTFNPSCLGKLRSGLPTAEAAKVSPNLTPVHLNVSIEGCNLPQN